jgi:hypothetical protein
MAAENTVSTLINEGKWNRLQKKVFVCMINSFFRATLSFYRKYTENGV